MKKLKFKWLENTSPYKGILSFFVILLITHIFWKLTMNGDESDNFVTFFGINLTNFFNHMSDHVAKTAMALLKFFHSDAILLPDNIIRHPNGESVRIIWACAGLKQAYIFTMILVLYKGPWSKKVWFIPLGLVVVYIYNIIRISTIAQLVENYPQMFELIHGYILKYLFYALIFGLWLVWEEKISGNNSKLVIKDEN